jgi:hypothetical protein
MKLSDMLLKAASLIDSRNAAGLGARMPYAELIQAADELEALGLSEWRKGRDTGRWLTPAGRAALKDTTHAE